MIKYLINKYRLYKCNKGNHVLSSKFIYSNQVYINNNKSIFDVKAQCKYCNFTLTDKIIG